MPWFALLISFAILSLWFDWKLLFPPRSPEMSNWTLSSVTHTPWSSLVAVLPVTEISAVWLNDTLYTLLDSPLIFHEIVIVCPESMASRIRRSLHQMFALTGVLGSTEISLQPWAGYLTPVTAVLRAASTLESEWILLLDDGNLRTKAFISEFSRPSNGSFVIPRSQHFDAPLVSHKSVLTDDASRSGNWGEFYQFITNSTSKPFTKVYFLGEDNKILVLHDRVSLADAAASENSEDAQVDHQHVEKVSPDNGRFSILIPTASDLQHLGELLCSLQIKGSAIRVLIYGTDSGIYNHNHLETEWCTLEYDTASPDSKIPSHFELLRWLQNPQQPDVVIGLLEEDMVSSQLSTTEVLALQPDTTIIRIPRGDLPYCQWLSSLELGEWKNWHMPRIDVSIITRDRPDSLRRLLDSLMLGRFYGDHPSLRVNIESDCDDNTLNMVDNFVWPYGQVFVHHRIIHGGLLPAVVESWYPKDKHSYGLLLEDDIELSPMFYAWIKMTILRYRYGTLENKSLNVFGISLYQQKILELLPQGRRLFNPRTLFMNNRTIQYTTPYLSQIPCSWGAVYFPEHWREFHDYLTVRLAELALPMEDIVVPNVRSNHWSKSWKKFFIELVYLRGYVMLYPNYEHFVSLSTNHLEVGAHVKVRSREKQESFLLPLMSGPTSLGRSTLLDLPDQTLPNLDKLPVLNLTGCLVSHQELVEAGHLRRKELFNCGFDASPFDVRSLMCISV